MNSTHPQTILAEAAAAIRKGAVLLRAVVGLGPTGQYLEGPSRLIQQLIDVGDAREASPADKIRAWPRVAVVD